MKKIILVLLVLLTLTSCGKKDEKDKQLSIVVPSGAPSLAFYNELDNSNFFTADAASIIPELGSDNVDIIVIDSVNGIKALNKGSNYKLAATITFGNFFIASTGIDDNGVMDEGDYIVVFSQGATPDLIFHYLYGDSLDSNLHYVQAVKDAQACLVKGINIADEDRDVNDEPYVEYVMIAEPALSGALSQNEEASVYANVQDLYLEKSNGLSMIQAGVFVSNKLDKDTVDKYLNNLENSISSLLENPDLFVQATSSLDENEIKDIFGIGSANLGKKVLTTNSIGLGYKKAIDNKDAIDAFVKIFGVDTTSEEIYYK